MIRYKSIIEYDGTNFCGMQKQNKMRTIQGEIEKALFFLNNNTQTEIAFSGRTDAGVHAIGQVIHFDLKSHLNEENVINGINFYLRKNNTLDICVLKTEKVDNDFHARFSTKMRSYIYKIKNRKQPLTFERNLFWHIPQKLNIQNMEHAVQYLIGQHDFSSFRSAECYAQSPIKTMEEIVIKQNNNEIHLHFKAKSFLYNMIRNITGTLVQQFGVKNINPEQMKNILLSKQRSAAGIKAPAIGLYLNQIEY